MQKLKKFWDRLWVFWVYSRPPSILPASFTPRYSELDALSDEEIRKLLNGCRDYKRKQKGLPPAPDFFKSQTPRSGYSFELQFAEDFTRFSFPREQ